MKKIITVILLSLIIAGTATAQLINADRTLFRTQTAKTFDKGQLRIYSNMNFYTKAGDFIGKTQPQNFKIVNYWLVAGNMIFTYGLWNHFDATLGIRVYQDTHYSNEFNLPDDIFLTFRAGSFVFGQGHFKSAFLTSFRFPTGEVHNYPFTPYASGAFEYGFLGAVSFYLDPYLPDRSFNMHYNIGWWNHNEAGKTIYKYERDYYSHKAGDELQATVSSKEFRMALAAVFPTDMFEFRLEMSGILYITPPDPFVYSAEEWAFFTPSIRYKPMDWVSMDIGADFRMSPKERQNTGTMIPDISKTIDMPPNYPDWRVHLGLNLNFNLLGKGARTVQDYEKERTREKVELIETLMDEKEKAKKAQEQIESLRKVRKEAEEEIKELKKLLEE